MLRLYHFDLARNTIDVETISPWALARPPEERNVLAAQEARLTTPVDYFSVPIDFDAAFLRVRPGRRAARPRPAKQVVVPGTLAYWRFDAGGANGAAFTSGQTIADLSGHGNDLTYQPLSPILGGNLDAQVTAVTDSGENPPDEVAVNLKDGDPSTKWLTFSPTGWVAYQMASPVAVVAYSLTSANDTPGRDPSAWTLQGSNDGSQ